MCYSAFNFSLYYSAFSLDAEQPDYDLDSEDEIFVNKLKKRMDISPLQFEEMIDRLEKGSGQQVQHHFELKNKKNLKYALFMCMTIYVYDYMTITYWVLHLASQPARGQAIAEGR